MKDWKSIGEIFRNTRKRKNYSVIQVQQMLRERFGLEISVKTIYGWEQGNSHPSVEIFLAVCDLYDLRNIGIFIGKGSFEDSCDLTDEDVYLLREYHSEGKTSQRYRHAIQDFYQMPQELRSY